MNYKICNEDSDYLIYEDGRVFSKKVNRFLTGKLDNSGYRLYVLKINGKKVYRYGHRLVAEHFLPNPKKLPVVNHKDYNKENNCVSNLEWITYKDNYNDYLKKNPQRKRRKTERYKEDLPNEQWYEIKDYSKYLVSNMGRIRNKKSNILIKYDSSAAYPRATLIHDDGSKKHQSIHLLVYCNCAQDYDLEGYVIDHIDADKQNCKFENLQKITPSENNLKQARFQK